MLRPAPRHAAPGTPARVLPSRSSLRLPAPLVKLAVAAGEVGGAHAEAAQHAGSAVQAAARPLGRTYGGRLGVSSGLSTPLRR